MIVTTDGNGRERNLEDEIGNLAFRPSPVCFWNTDCYRSGSGYRLRHSVRASGRYVPDPDRPDEFYQTPAEAAEALRREAPGAAR